MFTNSYLGGGGSSSDALSGVDGSVTYTSSPAWNYNQGGTYTITYTAKDKAGNIKTGTRTIKVISYTGNDGSGAAAPELADNMIPVKWNGTTWVKANPNVAKDWYDYNAKKWANAVTVTAATRSAYKNAAINTEVKESDILTYLVWIPRYKYKLIHVRPTLDTVAETIEVVFEDKNVAKSAGTTNGSYLTHPAFTFGSTELNGIWVGKFETTGSISSACTNESCTTASLTIKPNLTSIKGVQTISSLFYATRSMQRSGNIYGFASSGIDTHMMKNMEWGAVAYLTQSKYGKNSEVWINNNRNYITGCVGDSVSAIPDSRCQNVYSSTTGGNGSTTGNIYGIYDMSGGASENVMGTMYVNFSNNIMGGGFDQTILNSSGMSKYVDKYEGSTQNNWNTFGRRHLGDATGETFGWYSDWSTFVYSEKSWFLRGGEYSDATHAGLFCFEGGDFKLDYVGFAFRIVVSAS